MMRPLPALVAAAALGLTGCASMAPLVLPDDHPGSPNAAAGPVDAPTALADYKDGDDLASRAAADAGSAGSMQHGGMHHGAMPGMSHGDMPGMQHGGAPERAAPR